MSCLDYSLFSTTFQVSTLPYQPVLYIVARVITVKFKLDHVTSFIKIISQFATLPRVKVRNLQGHTHSSTLTTSLTSPPDSPSCSLHTRYTGLLPFSFKISLISDVRQHFSFAVLTIWNTVYPDEDLVMAYPRTSFKSLKCYFVRASFHPT